MERGADINSAGQTAAGDHFRSTASKDARTLRSSMALRQALLDLLDHKSFDHVTVRDICAEASVHYATFFRHHASKEALLAHVIADEISTVVDLTLPIRDEAGDDKALHSLCTYIDDHRQLWSVFLNGGAGATLREAWLRKAQTVAEDKEPIGSWLPKDLGTICSVSLIVETIAWWLKQPRQSHSATDIAAILHRLVTTSTLTSD